MTTWSVITTRGTSHRGPATLHYGARAENCSKGRWRKPLPTKLHHKLQHTPLYGSVSMSDTTSTENYARRGHSLLAENSVLQNQHFDVLSSLAPPFLAQQKMRMEASAARLEKLSLKLHDLVDDWSADARPT